MYDLDSSVKSVQCRMQQSFLLFAWADWYPATLITTNFVILKHAVVAKATIYRHVYYQALYIPNEASH